MSSGGKRILQAGVALLLLSPFTNTAFGQLKVGSWKEVVGKQVYDSSGDRIGSVRDVVLDVENGRYVGVLVATGGVLGIGETKKVVPPGALSNSTQPRALILNMDESKFRNAPTFELSKRVGPPDAARVAEVYHYYGQKPYFSPVVTPVPANRRANAPEQLGFVQRGANIRSLTVENLQGDVLGNVAGFRELERDTNSIKGIIISPDNFAVVNKIVPPQALRYNPQKTRLQLNDNDLPFSQAPVFAFAGGTRVLEEPPVLPAAPTPPVVQGSSDRDKNITMEIQKKILADGSLSHYARNVQVGTVRGQTTVRGLVESPKERAQIAAYAAEVVGPRNISLDLEVRPMTASLDRKYSPIRPLVATL
jgi:sporulation protein YlmC with PRC-barrel domain